MSEAEEICGGLACAAFCGICCVAAAEEDKREREASLAEKQTPVGPITPVAVAVVPCATVNKAREGPAKSKPRQKLTYPWMTLGS
ncbi:hypothetical protein ACHHYP_02507 [Achlya hypogyna]|uniref:Uncharacterized protein n=1 Tax=Achlya hypogyna TaxID=1202772 RepID=A0A1V9Z678_ACHHY|nr:hypothetical protein ACHHYP_02507 [Achlya hypogyna]